MAERQRMTADEVVAKLMSDEHADFVRESLRWVVEQLMEVEVSQLIGAELGERTPDRATHRNGYRPRRWDTRAGEIELQIPKLRRGSYFPSFLEPRTPFRAGAARTWSSRPMSAGSRPGRSTSWSSRSGCGSRARRSRDIAQGLDEQVEAFRQRPLEGRYPYLWLDAKVEKVRDGGRVRRKCLVIAHGVHETGRREVIALDVGEAETEAFWREFLRVLVTRGLVGVQLAISDAHPGLKAAIAQVLGCPWQRCTVHFLRDCLGHARRDQQPMLAALIRPIFNADAAAGARDQLSAAVAALEGKLDKVAAMLEEAEEDILAFYALPAPTTGASCARPTRSSGSTARSAGAPTWSASSPTTARSSGSPRCSAIEQNDEWLVGGALPVGRLDGAAPRGAAPPPRREEVLELTTA